MISHLNTLDWSRIIMLPIFSKQRSILEWTVWTIAISSWSHTNGILLQINLIWLQLQLRIQGHGINGWMLLRKLILALMMLMAFVIKDIMTASSRHNVILRNTVNFPHSAGVARLFLSFWEFWSRFLVWGGFPYYLLTMLTHFWRSSVERVGIG